MSDRKQWFKVFTSILSDPDFDDLHNQTIGVWVRLAALAASHGDSGSLECSASQFKKKTHLQNVTDEELDRIMAELETINVSVTWHTTNTKKGHESACYKCNVTFTNWPKYQARCDSYERVQKHRARYKSNTEEKRREEKRKKKIYKEKDHGNNGNDASKGKATEKIKDTIPYKEIIEYLNKATGKNFNPSTRLYREHIRARFRENHTLEAFLKVIDYKAQQWGNDAQMSEYLRPQTLFAGKFDSYLQQAEADRPADGDFIL